MKEKKEIVTEAAQDISLFFGGWTSVVFKEVFWPKKSIYQEFVSRELFSKMSMNIPNIAYKLGLFIFFNIQGLNADNMENKFKICDGFEVKGEGTEVVLGYKGYHLPSGNLPESNQNNKLGDGISDIEALCQAAFRNAYTVISTNSSFAHQISAGNQCSESDSQFSRFSKYIAGNDSFSDVNLAELWKNNELANSFLTNLTAFVKDFFHTDSSGQQCLQAIEKWRDEENHEISILMWAVSIALMACCACGIGVVGFSTIKKCIEACKNDSETWSLLRGRQNIQESNPGCFRQGVNYVLNAPSRFYHFVSGKCCGNSENNALSQEKALRP